jgi:hypothetical protein
MCGRASMGALNMIKVFAGKVRKTGFFQKAGFPGNSERIFGIYYRRSNTSTRVSKFQIHVTIGRSSEKSMEEITVFPKEESSSWSLVNFDITSLDWYTALHSDLL